MTGESGDSEEGMTADSSGGRGFTRLPVEDNKLLQRHPSVSKKKKKEKRILEFLHSVRVLQLGRAKAIMHSH